MIFINDIFRKNNFYSVLIKNRKMLVMCVVTFYLRNYVDRVGHLTDE